MVTDLSNPSVYYFSITKDGNRRYRLELMRGDIVMAEKTLSSFARAYGEGEHWAAIQRAFRDMKDHA